MKFGTLPIAEAEGCLLAHSLRVGRETFKKGRQLSQADVAAIAAAGVMSVMVARLGADDVPENDAATRLARGLAGDGVRLAEPFTGRANIYATTDGLLTYEPARLLALNGIAEALTVAALPPFERVAAGDMLATVKVIPFAVPSAVVGEAEKLAASSPPLFAVAGFAAKRAALIVTRFAATKPNVLQKRIVAVSERVTRLGGEVVTTSTVDHSTGEVAAAIAEAVRSGADPVLVFGASAIVDREDVIPAAVAAVGGKVVHLGMPVDPGNLLMVGVLGASTVIGVPSCAASPKLNGFDWVLQRHAAGLPIDRPALVSMAVGGLLKEIETRPQPRDLAPAPEARTAPRIGAIILAAGRSTRMGANNKLLAEAGGRPIIRRVTEAVLASSATPVVVVTGHMRAEIAAAVAGLPVEMVHNAAFADGLSGSLAAGIAAMPPSIDGTLVVLGDMPDIGAQVLDRLISAFAPKEGRSICVPVRGGRRGNPVLWSKAFFGELRTVKGDTGARHLIGDHADQVVEVEIEGEAIFTDLDTPEALAAWRQSGTARGAG